MSLCGADAFMESIVNEATDVNPAEKGEIPIYIAWSASAASLTTLTASMWPTKPSPTDTRSYPFGKLGMPSNCTKSCETPSRYITSLPSTVTTMWCHMSGSTGMGSGTGVPFSTRVGVGLPPRFTYTPLSLKWIPSSPLSSMSTPGSVDVVGNGQNHIEKVKPAGLGSATRDVLPSSVRA